MGKREWTRMARSGESLTVEFKRQIPKLERLARSLSAFSNSSGGTIFFGIDEDGEVVGLESVHGTRELVEQVAQFQCSPPVPVTIHEWEPAPRVTLLVVEVPEAQLKPVYAVNERDHKDAWPFFRSDKENLPLDRKSVKAMRRIESLAPEEVGELELDKAGITMLNYLVDHPRRSLNQLAHSANISAHRAKKIVVDLESAGWIHGFFNEKRREYSLVVAWKKK